MRFRDTTEARQCPRSGVTGMCAVLIVLAGLLVVSDLRAAEPAAALTGLTSRYMTDREAAVLQLTAVPEDEQAALVPRLAPLVKSDNWQVQNAAARVLQAYGPRAGAAQPAPRQAALAPTAEPAVPVLEERLSFASAGTRSVYDDVLFKIRGAPKIEVGAADDDLDLDLGL